VNRKLAPILAAVLLLGIMLVLVLARARQQGNITVLTGNHSGQAVELVPGRYQDTQCGMPVEHLRDSAQAVAADGKTWFFDDPGCLVLWLDKHRHPERLKLWVHSRDGAGYIDARLAWYSRTDSTTMEYGFGAYQDRQEGYVNFGEMNDLMLRGENLTNPYVRKELLGNR
jgi:copper chaperone NosL